MGLFDLLREFSIIRSDAFLVKTRLVKFPLCHIFEAFAHLFMEMDSQVLFYIATEDEAFLAINRERDAQSLMKERQSVQDQSDPSDTDSEELLQLDGKSISEWVSEIDAISKDVEAELVSRDIGCHLVQVLEAVNTVLFDLRGFKRTSITLDPENSYLHSVLNCRCSTGKSFLFIRLSQNEFPLFLICCP